MKATHILAILRSMDINELSCWFNHFYDHYGTSTRCMFLPKGESKKVLSQMMEDLGILKALDLWKTPGDDDIVYYDFEADSFEVFSSPSQILKYTDVKNFIPILEGKSYDEIFGWMEKPEPKVIKIVIKKF